MTEDRQRIQPKTDPLLERTLLEVEIPPCPEILIRIIAEMHKDEPDFNTLTDLISADVSLAAGLLKTTNSPFFLRPQRARSVHDALSILGLRVVSHTVAGIILRKAFPDAPSMVRFWDASARTARLSAWLAMKLDIPGLNADDAYTYGLFHDCGIPVLIARFPNYKEVLAAANSDADVEFTAREEALLQTNHAAVGCALAQKWWLPEDMYVAIRHHHQAKALEPGSNLPLNSRMFIATSQFAEYISQQKLGLEMTQEWSKLGAGCLRTLKIDNEDLDFLFEEARQVLDTQD
jgi:HD-like signal output (HDOD) protein